MAKTYIYKGEARSQRIVVGPDHAPCTVAAVAAHLPASQWYRRQVSEGTKGPIEDVVARQRVTLCKEGLPEHPVWLVIKRTVGADPVSSYSILKFPPGKFSPKNGTLCFY
jgi:hypothetical protein